MKGSHLFNNLRTTDTFSSFQVWLTLVRQQKAIAVIRTSDMKQGQYMAQSVAAGGMRLIEVGWNSDRAADLIEQLRSALPDCVIGAGTVLSATDVEQAIAAGAQFLFSPHTNLSVIEAAIDRAVPIVPGALSPTEIVAAWQFGAPAVKVFPIQAVGGAAYIRSLQGPLGAIPLIPTGGVTVETAQAFIEAGAIAVGLSGELFSKTAIGTGDWSAITLQARTLMQHLNSLKD